MSARDSVVLNVNPKKAAVAVGVEEHPIAGNETIHERLRDLVFSISANSFFQTNTRQAERLFGIVAEYAGLTGQETVLDLYAGTGAISLLLARRGAGGLRDRARAGRDRGRRPQRAGERHHELHVPAGRGAARAARPACARRAGRRGGRRPAPRRVSPEGAPEPRHAGGAASSTSPAIPATLARDLATLCAAGYRITAVQPVDMFPHTPHIEVVVRLERPA